MGIFSKLIFGDLLGDLLTGVTDAVEAEGRQLRRGVMQLLVALQVLVVSLLILLAAVGFILWGFYALLEPCVGQWGRAFIVGGVSLLIGLALAVCARRLAR